MTDSRIEICCGHAACQRTAKDAVRDGREEGAKHMRAVIEAYLTKHGVPYPPLPMTLGERKQAERDWDQRVQEGVRE